MTIERKESIKRNIEVMDNHLLKKSLRETLAALEETEQTLDQPRRNLLFELHNERAHKENAKRQLEEAQQTIARQREALESIKDYSYDDEVIDIVNAAICGGAKEVTTLSFPNCPTCNSDRTIAHPSKAGTWLCVPCDKVFEDGARP